LRVPVPAYIAARVGGQVILASREKSDRKVLMNAAFNEHTRGCRES
jgi:hypothetical protein